MLSIIIFIIMCFNAIYHPKPVLAWVPVIDDIKKAGENIAEEAKNCFSGGCDPVKVAKKGLKSLVSSAVEGASEEVEESVIRAADHIFDNQVDPLLERAGVLSKEIISFGGEEAETRAKNIINYAVKDVVEGFTPWIEEASRIADKFAPEEIEKHLINTSFDRLDKLENKIFKDANLFLDRVAKIVDDVDCFATGTATKVRDDIYRRILIRIETPTRNQIECAKQHNIKIKLWSWGDIFFGTDDIPITQAEDGQVYAFTKCVIEKDISIGTNTEKIIQRYSDLASLAADYRCIERRGAPEYYTREWLEFKTKAELWLEIYD
ncbi:MAG: hypothetical protein F6K01_09770 [Okeania sp. SIO1I7]|nr:hypothetical protein [Okeania sp. SIO1I7]